MTRWNGMFWAARAVLAGTVGLLLLGQSLPVLAQSNASSTQRDQLVESLLRSLIEAELDQRSVSQPATTTQENVGATANDLTRARRILEDVTREANRLTTALNDEQVGNPAIRPLLSDVLKARARVAVIAERSSRVRDPKELQTDLRSLDRDWRVLAYRLGRIRNLRPASRQSIAQLNEYESQLRDLFNVPAQLDYVAIFQESAALASSMDHLLDDVQLELDREPQMRTLLLEGRKIEQQVQHLVTLVGERAEYETLTTEYRRFQELWLPFSIKLRPFQNRYLERAVRRVDTIDTKMHELFFLPQKVNRQQLLHLTSVLRRDVDTFFERAPLKLLINLPNSAEVLPTADQFYGVCDNFIDCVERGEDYDNLTGCFSYIEDSWVAFYRMFRPLKSDSAQQVLTEIEQNIVALRKEMQLQQPGFDRNIAADLAAALENLAEHLDTDTQAWLNRARPNFRVQAARESAAFATAAHRFHQNINSGGNINTLQAEAAQLYDQWRRVYSYISQSSGADRTHLGSLAARITPTLVELRTIVTMNDAVAYAR